MRRLQWAQDGGEPTATGQPAPCRGPSPPQGGRRARPLRSRNPLARGRGLARAAATVLLLGLPCAIPADGSADDIAASLYVRGDTDRTLVITPHLSGRVRVLDDMTHVEVGYAADIWTSASIDIRTAATKVITEQRDEINVAVDRELEDTTVRASYRYSHEPDYVSHGGSLALVQDFADNNATVDTALTASQDRVGRSGDDDFDRASSTVGIRITYTQVLSPATIMQTGYELRRREGYQAGPYRYVGIGGDGLCGGTARLCLAETHPPTRLRNAVIARLNHSLAEDRSIGVAYRFYLDDWGVFSNTLLGDFHWLPDERSTVGLRYRLYRQSEASFYEPIYDVPDAGQIRYVTRNKSLSSMWTNRLAVSYERKFQLTDAGPPIRATLAGGGMLLSYENFLGLGNVWAFDLTVAATVEL